jgi:hypothetical protein
MCFISRNLALVSWCNSKQLNNTRVVDTVHKPRDQGHWWSCWYPVCGVVLRTQVFKKINALTVPLIVRTDRVVWPGTGLQYADCKMVPRIGRVLVTVQGHWYKNCTSN